MWKILENNRNVLLLKCPTCFSMKVYVQNSYGVSLGVKIFWLSHYRGACHHDNQQFTY